MTKRHPGSTSGISPKMLEGIRPLYFLPVDNLAEEALIPGFQFAEMANCMVGFFSSAALADLAPGLASYIERSRESFRLIISPFIGEQDRQAIERGVRRAEDVLVDVFDEYLSTTDALQQHTLKCFSYLLAAGRFKIKIALLEDALFHPKVWIFNGPAGMLAVHGSSNLTQAGIRRNFEQITVSKSWIDPTQRYIVEKLQDQFERLWSGREDYCLVVELPEAVREKLLRSYSNERPPTEDEFRHLFRKAQRMPRKESAASPVGEDIAVRPIFAIPTWLRYDDGPYEHQGRAVRAWCEAGYRGVLEMATGSGKTLTAMICAHRLFEHHTPLLVVVAAPYIPLIDQWCDEITQFGVQPINLTTAGSASARARVLQGLRRRLRLGLAAVEVVVVSHDTLCTEEFASVVSGFECERLLIADEAHNLGRHSFIANPPTFFEHRLALSATPVRQYDPDGTEAVFQFFGPVVFRFTLEEAIGLCLVEYDYYVHPVRLSDTEMDAWYDLTERIRQNAWRAEDGRPDEFLAKLLRDRRALLETAQQKVDLLATLLDREDRRSLRYTLIYASDKAPEQLEAVNRLLQRQGFLFHQLTAEETANRDVTRRIIRSFQAGEIQVLTAKRVLDEGVNIPQICKAFVLASTTVGRQWIQRRGRLLRTCREIGKTHSVIHDFLALPPSFGEALDPDARSLVEAELRRAQEFARLARNAGKRDGPLAIIDQLASAAFS